MLSESYDLTRPVELALLSTPAMFVVQQWDAQVGAPIHPQSGLEFEFRNNFAEGLRLLATGIGWEQLNSGFGSVISLRFKVFSTVHGGGDVVSATSPGPIDMSWNSVAVSPIAPPSAVTVVECLDSVRTQLSLTATHVAELLRVTRPTLYAWRRGTAPSRTPHAFEQLAQLHSIAIAWRGFDLGPLGSLLVTPLGDGSTLLSLLKNYPLDRERVMGALQVLREARERTLRRRRGRSQRGVASAMKRLGIPENDPEAQAQRIIADEYRAHDST